MRDGEFEFIRRLVYQRSRINLTTDKRALVSARLGQRLRATNIGNFADYCRLLRSPHAAEELSNLIDVISTNHTFFFREGVHFNFLRDCAVAEMQTRHGRRSRFYVWSAASSSGEEPYSIAMTLAGCLPQNNWHVEASDISRTVLERAESGIYAADAVKRLPPDVVRKYFQRGFGPREGKFRIKAALRERVSFQQLNLLEHEPPFKEPFDVIFCRNVMIYFDHPTREELIARLTRRLVPGGYLFVGHSESLTGLHHSLKVVRPAVYQRPLRSPSHV
jgi:chemotaxis protein methyltransferase CheR